jgi:hypothetical protein
MEARLDRHLLVAISQVDGRIRPQEFRRDANDRTRGRDYTRGFQETRRDPFIDKYPRPLGVVAKLDNIVMPVVRTQEVRLSTASHSSNELDRSNCVAVSHLCLLFPEIIEVARRRADSLARR